MNNYIAFCGLDCERCEARLATVNSDEALRRKVAALWSELNGVEIPADSIYCTGCRIDGVKTPYCEFLCPIRACAMEKELETCGACPERKACEKLGAITRNNPEALCRLEAERGAPAPNRTEAGAPASAGRGAHGSERKKEGLP